MRVAILGYGKIGQAIYRAIVQRGCGLQLVAVGDQRFGRGLNPPAKVGQIVTANSRTGLPWDELKVEVVVDATGAATTRMLAAEHLASGAQRVLVTASMPDPDATLIFGVNQQTYDRFKHFVISASSCTTLCFAPVYRYLAERLKVKNVEILVYHGYDPKDHAADVDLTRVEVADQRSFPLGGMVPYRTNMATNLIKVLPELKGKVTVEGYYNPPPNVLLLIATLQIKEKVPREDVMDWLHGAAQRELKGWLHYAEKSVFTEVAGSSYPTTFFSELTRRDDASVALTFGGDYVKGYATGIVKLLNYLQKTANN